MTNTQEKIEILGKEEKLELNKNITYVQMSFLKDLLGILNKTPANQISDLELYRAANDDVKLAKAA